MVNETFLSQPASDFMKEHHHIWLDLVLVFKWPKNVNFLYLGHKLRFSIVKMLNSSRTSAKTSSGIAYVMEDTFTSVEAPFTKLFSGAV